MNLEQAQIIKARLLYLEGIITRTTNEYIWKVLIAPAGMDEIRGFAASIDPAKPFKPEILLKNYLTSDLSVYFFLKKNGEIVYRNYDEFLYKNDIRIDIERNAPKSELAA
jgi:hypothetical protein